MPSKYFIGFILLVVATFGGTVAACMSRRVRDVFFFLIVAFSCVATYYDINFVSREWYRGTTCGFEISIVDVLAISLLIGCILFPRPGEKRFFWPASLGLMIVLFLYTVLCVALSDPKLFGYFALSKLVRGIVIFMATALYVRNERELRIFMWSLALVVCYEGTQALRQRYGYGIHRTFGTLDDANSLSMFMVMTGPVLVVALTSKVPKLLQALSAVAVLFACVGVALTISRAGLIIMGLVLVGALLATVSFSLTPKNVAIALTFIAAAGGITFKTWGNFRERFASSTLEQEYEDKRSMGRGYYIRLAIAMSKEHWFGIGPNNWSYWVSNLYGPQEGWKFTPYPGTDHPPKFTVRKGAKIDDPQAAPAHSLLALTLGETGLAGLVVLLLLWLRWFQMGLGFLWKRTDDPMRRLGVGLFFGMCGIFLQSLTEWVYHQTQIYFTFHIMLGVLASLYRLKKLESRAQKALEAEPVETWEVETAVAMKRV